MHNQPTNQPTNQLVLSLLTFLLVFNLSPTDRAELKNFQAADVVIGQPDFDSNTANNGGVSARSLNTCRGVFSTGDKLIVSDDSNHRVLIWNSMPTVNQQPADVVIGQPDFTSNSANQRGRLRPIR